MSNPDAPPPGQEDLLAATAAMRAWMTEAALPYWSTIGYGGARLGFVEQLDPAGRPVPAPYRSTLVQARQAYVFAHAAVLGWPGGLAAAQEALHFLLQHAWHPEGGWVRVVDHDGRVRDGTRELYDAAFMLLALAWVSRATGDPAPIGWAHRTLDLLEAGPWSDGTPGFANRLPTGPEPRLQNPHMHLLEAAMALQDATGEPRFAELARRLLRLFAERLFDPETGTLAELYGPAWQRLPEPYPGRQIWPGHHHEWVWLLHQARRHTGLDLRAEALALFRFAARHGTDPGTGLVRYAVTEEGVVLDGSVRLWPQTEALKAELALLEAGSGNPSRIAGLLRRLLARHLARSPRGTWTERYEAGAPVAGLIPADALYHLFLAHAELMRVVAPR